MTHTVNKLVAEMAEMSEELVTKSYQVKSLAKLLYFAYCNDYLKKDNNAEFQELFGLLIDQIDQFHNSVGNLNNTIYEY